MLPLKKQIEPPLRISHKSPKVDDQAAVVSFLIEHKKQSYKQFKDNVRLFFSLGVFVSLLLVIAVFNWKSYDKAGQVEIAQVDNNVEELMDIPLTQQPPPPPKQQIQQPNIIEVSEEKIIEDIDVDFDIEITNDEAIADIEAPAEMDQPEEEVADEIFSIVEDQPHPVGGLASFMAYISENIVYPERARNLGVQGKVFLTFVVNADGSITDINVVKGIGAGCDEEAVKVLQNAPKWAPGKQRGIPVRVRMTIPIFFILRE